MKSNLIIFYDGNCGLCHTSVRWLLKKDRMNKLMFAPLQGETAKQLLKTHETGNYTTLVYYSNGKTRTKSDGVLAALCVIGSPWSWLYALRYVPRFIRNGVYDFVARNRHRLFATFEDCPLPTIETKERFLP